MSDLRKTVEDDFEYLRGEEMNAEWFAGLVDDVVDAILAERKRCLLLARRFEANLADEIAALIESGEQP